MSKLTITTKGDYDDWSCIFKYGCGCLGYNDPGSIIKVNQHGFITLINIDVDNLIDVCDKIDYGDDIRKLGEDDGFNTDRFEDDDIDGCYDEDSEYYFTEKIRKVIQREASKSLPDNPRQITSQVLIGRLLKDEKGEVIEISEELAMDIITDMRMKGYLDEDYSITDDLIHDIDVGKFETIDELKLFENDLSRMFYNIYSKPHTRYRIKRIKIDKASLQKIEKIIEDNIETITTMGGLESGGGPDCCSRIFLGGKDISVEAEIRDLGRLNLGFPHEEDNSFGENGKSNLLYTSGKECCRIPVEEKEIAKNVAKLMDVFFKIKDILVKCGIDEEYFAY